MSQLPGRCEFCGMLLPNCAECGELGCAEGEHKRMECQSAVGIYYRIRIRNKKLARRMAAEADQPGQFVELEGGGQDE